MEKRPQKMWVREKVEPSEKFRETIFTTDKNLKDQFVNFNEKRGLQEIKNQTSFIFHLDKKNYDRSLVAAPTRQLRIDRYYQLKANPHRQRETIFSTPAVLEKINKYKSLDSKKHYANIQKSTNMNGILDYNFANTQRDQRKGKKRYPEVVKNQSSVGNPILFHSEAETRHSQSARQLKETVKATGNMHLNTVEIREFPTSNEKAISKWADLQATHIFRKKNDIIDNITKGFPQHKLL